MSVVATRREETDRYTASMQSDIDKILQNYTNAIKIIQQIENIENGNVPGGNIKQSSDRIAKDQQHISDLEKTIAKLEDALIGLGVVAASEWWNPVGWAAMASIAAIGIAIAVLEGKVSDAKGDEDQAKDHLSDLTGQIKQLTQQLSVLSPSFTPLCNAINQLLNDFNNVLSSMSEYLSGDAAKLDVQTFEQALNTLIQALSYKAKEIEDGGLIDEGSGDVMTLAADMIALESSEGGLLTGLTSKLNQALQNFNDATTNASYEKHTTRWYDWIAAGTTSQSTKSEEATIQNGTMMTNLIADTIGNIDIETAGLMPNMQEVNSILQKIMKEVEKILSDTTLSPSQKQEKILNLFVIVMSLLTLIQGYATQYKSQQDKQAQDTTLTAQQAQANHSLLLTREMAADVKYAHDMKILMAVAEAVIAIAMAAVTVVTAGSAASIACAVMTVLFAALAVVDLGLTASDKESLMDRATQALANSLKETFGGSSEASKIAADVLIGAIEIVSSLGAAGAIKAVTKALETAAVAAVMAGVRSIVEVAVQTAFARVGATLMFTADVAAGAAQTAQVINEAAQQAAEQAAKQVFKEFVKQNISQLLVSLVKTGGPRALMAQAAEQAAKKAAEDAADLIISTGKFGDFTPAIQAQFQKIAASAATASVARVMHTTAEDVTKSAGQESWHQTKEIARASALFGYAVASTSLLTDVAKYAQKEDKKLNDSEFENLMTAIQIIQQLLQAVSMGIAGMSAVGSLVTDTLQLTKLSTGSQAIAAAGTAIGSAGTGEANWAEGSVQAAMIKNKAVSDMMSFLADEIKKNTAAQQRRDLDLQTKSEESTFRLSSHLFDNWNALAQVLGGTAV